MFVEMLKGITMTSNAKLTLIYFKMRALAEPPQLLLNYANIPYEYKMSWEYFDKPWDVVKPDVPFGQLPLLVTKWLTDNIKAKICIKYRKH